MKRAAQFFEVPERNAVLHRHDHRLGSDQLRQIVDHAFNLMRFHGENHYVLHANGGVIIACLDVAGNLLHTVVQDQLHAVSADGVEVPAANDKRDVFTGQCELCAY